MTDGIVADPSRIVRKKWRKVPKPKHPTAAHFRHAREIVGKGRTRWSVERVAETTRELGLAVPESAINQLENDEDPGAPFTDEAGADAALTDMPYHQRLHLAYLMLGCVFLPEGRAVWANPIQLWGAFASLETSGPSAGQQADMARLLIERAVEHAKRSL